MTGWRGVFALGRCPGMVLNLYTGLWQSCVHKQECSLSHTESNKGNEDLEGPEAVSYCLPGLCLFHLDQILLWDAVNLCQLLQNCKF